MRESVANRGKKDVKQRSSAENNNSNNDNDNSTKQTKHNGTNTKDKTEDGQVRRILQEDDSRGKRSSIFPTRAKRKSCYGRKGRRWREK